MEKNNSPQVHGAKSVPADIQEILDYFMQALPGRVVEMQTALQAEEWDKLKKCVHKLRGAAGTCGFLDLMHKLEDIEKNLFAERDSAFIAQELAKLPLLTSWDSSLLL